MIKNRNSPPLVLAMGVLIVTASVLSLLPLTAAASDTVTRWDSFSESSTCGAPYTRTPYASKTGSLSDSELILGPYGTYFGRSVAEVRSRLVWWTVPGSGGVRVQVNEVILPALQRVSDALNAEASKGRVYPVTSVAAFVPRTIGGSHQISRHALGLAIDFNPHTNPFRSDNRLITDMPEWFVDIWKEAGFCWGGDWRYSKDAMHFSWMGPEATPEDDSVVPSSPRTQRQNLAKLTGTIDTEFGPVVSKYHIGIADGTGNGASDVLGVRAHPDGSVLDIASSTYGYGECSIERWFIDDSSLSHADHLVYADIDGDSGLDLIGLTASSGSVSASISKRSDEYRSSSTSLTGISPTSQVFTGADFNRDGIADLWEATTGGLLRIWDGLDFGRALLVSELPSGAPTAIAAGDRDGGDTPELFALYEEEGETRLEALDLKETWVVDQSLALGSADSKVALGAGDYDGDGRSDAQVLASTGVLDVYIGNSTTGIPEDRWFLRPDRECAEDPILLSYEGEFFDDEGSIFESHIDSIARVGVTRGCNPPFDDRFCPEDPVTREMMAAFLVRALGLTASDHPGFDDVPADSTFAADIGRLATAGITKGCNPPDNDRFCPKDPVTRETMAAFLVRALALGKSTHSGFVDVPGSSTFAEDIGRLATAGITKGCNPPANDRFCPTGIVTREMMAAFLDRSGLGS